MAKKKTDSTTVEKIGVVIGLTATAVAAASAYFLYGSEDAHKNRKAVKSWMLKAKAEVLERLEEAKEMDQEEYAEIINTVAGIYSEVKNASKKDIKAFKEEMLQHWEKIEKVGKPKKKPVKKAPTKKTDAKPAKKSPKKDAKKVTQEEGK